MDAPELLRAYLAEIQVPAAVAALFAEDGVIELPTINARAGTCGDREVRRRAARQSTGLSLQERSHLDRDARAGLRRVRGRGARPFNGEGLQADLCRTPRRREREDQVVAGGARHARGVARL